MKDKNSEKKIIFIYHAECPDGFGSAYCAWKKFGDTAEYLPSLYKNDPNDVPDALGREVYIFDYSFPREVLEKMKKEARKLVMIDHHKTNEENIKVASEFIFDNEHSASVLTWKYFNPTEKVPKMFLYIEETDIWRFSLPKTKELGMFIDNQEYDFKLWEELVSGFEDENKLAEYIKEGERLVAKRDGEVENIVRHAKEIVFEGYKTLIVHATEYTSEVGNTLCKKLPPIGIIWSKKGGKIAVSLRGDGTTDVSKLAEKYGGGGHKSAAGFVVDNEEELNKIFNL